MLKKILFISLVLFSFSAVAQKTFFYIAITGVEGKKEYTIFNNKGEQVIPGTYSWINVNAWSWIIVSEGKKLSVYDSLGKKLPLKDPVRFQNIPLGAPLVPVLNDKNKWGYYSRDGVCVVPHEYDEVTPFFYGKAAVKKGDKFFYIDAAGEKMHEKYKASDPGVYDFVEIDTARIGMRSFASNTHQVFHKGKHVGIKKISDGTVIVEAVYDDFYNFQNGQVTVKKKNLVGVITLEGKVIVPVQYTEIEVLRYY
jgi:hypothetical protein